jgi:LacI family transcriptional regulator
VNDHGNDHSRRQQPRRITILDVAARAGVSRQTVSRAMNDKADIRAETRQRILRVAQEMGYRPSSLARGLKTNRTRTIGLVVPDIANPFFAEVARGAAEAAYDEDYSVLLCNTDEQPVREWAILEMLEAHSVDGLILVSSRLSDDQLQRALAAWPPCVVVNRRLEPQPGAGCVLVRDALAAQWAMRHLLERGHRRIGLLAGAPTSRSGQERQRGYRLALEAAGLATKAEWHPPCDPTVEGGYRAALALLTSQPMLTALLAYNDLVALGAQQACRELDRRIPLDCALVGWDDIVFSSHVSPPLTTVRMPKRQIGERAMALLFELIQDPSLAPPPVALEAELIIRDST